MQGIDTTQLRVKFHPFLNSRNGVSPMQGIDTEIMMKSYRISNPK